ncbi:NAD-dependent epimerase/dehydratase family protein [Vibrio scophthalmi]|uniref:NAD-dependent epimerase/dehydratase family protein n=1 Tax=Vibrio scophthalmi TaxID=45658 RepID=UPI003AAB859C
MLVITGSSGFIGKKLVESLSNREKLLLLRGTASNFRGGVLYSHSPNELLKHRDAFSKNSVIIHLAGLAHVKGSSKEAFEEANVLYPVELFKAAENLNVKRFVFVSSIGVNGESTSFGAPFAPNSIASPHSEYARSKYRAELKLKELAKNSRVELVIVRPPLVYGSSAPGNFSLLTKFVAKIGVTPFGLASNRRSFVSVENLCSLLEICADHPRAAGNTFLASDNETVSIKEFTDAIAKGQGTRVYHLPVPITLIRILGKVMGKSSVVDQLFGNLEVDSSNANELLDWTPPLTMKQAMTSLRNLSN